MGHGGAREGAGRPPRAEEEKAVALIKQALKVVYSKDTDEEAVLAFLVEFAEIKEGKKFFAEHLLGKPKQSIDLQTDNMPVIEFTSVVNKDDGSTIN